MAIVEPLAWRSVLDMVLPEELVPGERLSRYFDRAQRRRPAGAGPLVDVEGNRSWGAGLVEGLWRGGAASGGQAA